jgi:hypothetical protein
MFKAGFEKFSDRMDASECWFYLIDKVNDLIVYDDFILTIPDFT